MEVHRTLGSGYLESIFREALGIEFGIRQVPFTPEVPCAVFYKGQRLTGTMHVDFVCFDDVLVEVKARSTIAPADWAQLLNYLASLGAPCGLLLNFGAPRLQFRRFVLSGPPAPEET